MITAFEKQTDGTIKLTITIPVLEIEKEKTSLLASYKSSAKMPGFRKGKAPEKLVEKNIDKDKLKEDILRNILPKAYNEAVLKHSLKPIINPKIHVESVEEGKDWQLTVFTCEMPEVNLNDYKEKIAKITSKSKIVIPGKENKAVNFDDVVKTLLQETSVTIPKIILNQETERLLAQTLDEVKSLGLSLDQYLASTKKTAEDLRSEYAKKAENDVKLEFALQKIAETEKISVDEKEIDEAIAKAKDEKERKHLESNRYLLASILRQQKTLDFLRAL